MSGRFRLESQGLVPLDDHARSELRARGGEYALAPTVPDLFCLVRAQSQGGQGPTPKVVLAGDASGFPLSDLVAFLSQSRWTGAVRVRAPSGERVIALRDGEIRGATSDNPADRLGEVMVRLGYLTRPKLEAALKDTPPSRIGRTLVERGVLQAHDVWKCINQQVSDIFEAIILCREGTFFLVNELPDEKTTQNVQLSMQSLLMEAIRKVDELAHFRKRIPNVRMYVVPKKASDGKLEEDEDRVLALVDGKSTIQELGMKVRLGEFDIVKIVFRLLEGGYATLSESQGAGPPPAPGTAAHAKAVARDPLAVLTTFNQIFAEIRGVVAKQDMDKELVATVNAALAGNALSSSPLLFGMTLDPEGKLPEDKMMKLYDQLRPQLGSEPVASLRQALSDLMFFLLFQAGELLESSEDEQLAKRVKELLARLDG